MSVYNTAVIVPSPLPVDSMKSSPWQLHGGQQLACALFLIWSAAAAEGLRISQRLPPHSNQTGNQCSILTPDKLTERRDQTSLSLPATYIMKLNHSQGRRHKGAADFCCAFVPPPHLAGRARQKLNLLGGQNAQQWSALVWEAD